ncbi:MAG: LysE family translocator [Enterobacterales bacterium]|nr:LysE family translocator [Enterobacterales bacterium]
MEQFLILATVNMIAVASPGPDFAMVLKNTLQSGRKHGIATAFGIGLGILVHLTYTLLGIGFILSKSALIYAIIKWAGAAYLVYLAFMSFKSAKKEIKNTTNLTKTDTLPHVSKGPIALGLKQGFLVNVLNPKATLFFIAIFTTIVNPATAMSSMLLYALWIFVYVIAWFSLIAWAFSGPKILNWYQQHGYYIDWLMGVLLLLLAIRIVV